MTERTHTSTVPPTVKDIARFAAKLNDYTIDRTWDNEDRQHMADNIAFVIGRTVKLHRVTRRDVAVILAAAGASDKVIELHARDIASRIRSNFKDDRMSAFI